jgi:hypothetical protein
VFSNQMLFYEDNARFALQAMNWLRHGGRSNLLILNDDRGIAPADPQAVQLTLPPPTREQVWQALRQLPPEMLLEFGNEVAALVEDENLVNEVLSMAFEDVSDTRLFRSLIFLSTFLLSGFLFYRYMSSESTIQDVTGTDTRQFGGPAAGWIRKRRRVTEERITVARELVSRFYGRVSGGLHSNFSGFPARLTLVNCDRPEEPEGAMRQTGKWLNWKFRHRWTPARLAWLQNQLQQWEQLYHDGQLVFEATGSDTHQRVAGSRRTKSSGLTDKTAEEV